MGSTSIRGFNRSAVLSTLLSIGETERPRLVAETGLSQATVFRIICVLLVGKSTAHRDNAPAGDVVSDGHCPGQLSLSSTPTAL